LHRWGFAQCHIFVGLGTDRGTSPGDIFCRQAASADAVAVCHFGDYSLATETPKQVGCTSIDPERRERRPWERLRWIRSFRSVGHPRFRKVRVNACHQLTANDPEDDRFVDVVHWQRFASPLSGSHRSASVSRRASSRQTCDSTEIEVKPTTSGLVAPMAASALVQKIVEPVRLADAPQVHVHQGRLMAVLAHDSGERQQAQWRRQFEAVMDAIGGLYQSQLHVSLPSFLTPSKCERTVRLRRLSAIFLEKSGQSAPLRQA
jgi:hypothetical protein